MADLKIAILGLGRVGSSIGLALKRYMEGKAKHSFDIIGHDPRGGAEKEASKLGAVHRTEGNAGKAVQGADLVIMNLPYAEVKAAYQYIAPDLRDGVVILDMSPVKGPSLEWAKKYLTEEHHVIGMTPVINAKYLFEDINKVINAEADFFDRGSIVLTPGPGCIKEAVELAFNFSTLLGAKPAFADPAEHDALVAFTEQLPSLLGTAVFYTALKNQGWDDIRRITNPAFGSLTSKLFDTHPDDLRDAWMANRASLVHHLDTLMATLSQLRERLAEDDKHAVEAVLVESAQEYEVWLNQRRRVDWGDIEKPKVQPSQTMMGSLLGGSFANRLFGNNKDEDE